jgi:uncharacterized protein (DUF2062 family)
MISMITTFYHSNKQRLRDQISKELSVSKLAMAVSWGCFLGVIPIFCGANIALSVLVCWRFKLNHLLVQLISNLIYPLQIILFVPFIQLGGWFFSGKEFMMSGKMILDHFKTNAWEGICMLGHWNLYGLLAWLLVCSPFCLGLYFITNQLFSRKRQNTTTQLQQAPAQMPMTELTANNESTDNSGLQK